MSIEAEHGQRRESGIGRWPGQFAFGFDEIELEATLAQPTEPAGA